MLSAQNIENNRITFENVRYISLKILSLNVRGQKGYKAGRRRQKKGIPNVTFEIPN